MAQQGRMLDMLLPKIPAGASPVMRLDMGWRYQYADHAPRLREAGVTQSMSRKGNRTDNAATEQLFGHARDEFYRGRERETFEDFRREIASGMSM